MTKFEPNSIEQMSLKPSEHHSIAPELASALQTGEEVYCSGDHTSPQLLKNYEIDFCRQNTHKFSGKQYCMACQLHILSEEPKQVDEELYRKIGSKHSISNSVFIQVKEDDTQFYLVELKYYENSDEMRDRIASISEIIEIEREFEFKDEWIVTPNSSAPIERASKRSLREHMERSPIYDDEFANLDQPYPRCNFYYDYELIQFSEMIQFEVTHSMQIANLLFNNGLFCELGRKLEMILHICKILNIPIPAVKVPDELDLTTFLIETRYLYDSLENYTSFLRNRKTYYPLISFEGRPSDQYLKRIDC